MGRLRFKRVKKCVSLIVVAFFVGMAGPAFAYTLATNQSADVVVGQTDFTSTSTGTTANTLNSPRDVSSDGTRLFIVDRSNNRVLIYNSIPTSNGTSADVVVGQSDFTSGGSGTTASTLNNPDGVYSDGTRLFIADYINNRVLIYNSIPTSNGASADVVIGQPDFTSSSRNQGGSPAANTLDRPLWAYSDGTRLFIADYLNNRVLIYNSIPTENNASADIVIGQPDFTSNSANQGGSSAANTLYWPTHPYSDGTRLFITDTYNARVLIYNSIPTSNNASADIVIGQADFTSRSSNQGGSTAANTLGRWVESAYSDGTRLFIADPVNNRLLIYNTIPTANNASADIVIGQADFTSNSANQGGNPAANTLYGLTSTYPDGTRVFVADWSNNRILIYNLANTSSSSVTKTANRERIMVGDVVTYTISTTNNETGDFLDVKVADTIPSGFEYLSGSALKDGATLADPSISGRKLTFSVGTISSGSTVTLNYQLAVGSGVQTEQRYLNTCTVTDSTGKLNISATVEKGVYVERFSLLDTIIGKVFKDTNSNGWQDEGEVGIAGVDLYTEDGVKVTTGFDGRYHLPTAGESIPSGRIELIKVLKLDTATLPPGYELTTEESRIVTLSDGLLAKVNFGAVLTKEETIEAAFDSQETPDSTKKLIIFDQEEFFMVGIAEGEISQRSVKGNLEPVKKDDRYKDTFFKDGRVAYYLKGKIKGKYLVTSSFDSERRKESFLFRNLNPNKYYPVYGDSSTINYQANNTQGNLYLLVEWDESEVLWGNYITPLNQTELGRYIRTLYGGKLDYKSTKKTRYGDPSSRLILFQAEAYKQAAHNEFLSTGGSIYYLNHKEIIEGSEKIRLEVRDETSNIVLDTIYLAEEKDYTIDYSQGLIRFIRPVSMIAASSFLISSELLSGNPVYIISDYEYEPAKLWDESTYGGRVTKTFWDHLTLGLTGLEETKGGNDYHLTAGDLTLKLKENTKLTYEYASSDTEQIDSLISYDGGLSFTDLTTTSSEAGKAFSLRLTSQLGEWFKDQQGIWPNISAYFQRIDPGFSSSGMVQEQGKKKYGLSLSSDLSQKDKFTLDWQTQRFVASSAIQDALSSAETPLTQNSQADRYTSLLTRLTHSETKWNLTGEFRREERKSPKGKIDDKETNTLAGRLGYFLTEDIDLFLKQQLTLKGANNRQTSLGVRAQVMKDLLVEIEQTISRGGDATQIRLEKNVSPDMSYYLAQTFSRSLGEEKSHLSFGRKAKINESTNIYTEDQYITSSSEEEGTSYNRVIGLNTEFENGWSVDLNYQSTQQEREDILSRRTVSIGLNYLSEEWIEFATRFELRQDRGTENKNQLVTYNKLKYFLSPSTTLLTEYNYSLTDNKTTFLDEARYQEIALGLAYRPIFQDRLNLLFKYTNSIDQRPLNLTSGTKDLSKTSVVSIEAAYDLSRYLQLIEEFAFRQRKSKYGLSPEVTSDTYLWINRMNYHLTNQWDLGLEGRILTSELTDDQKVGYLFEVSRAVTSNIWVGLGYDFSEFTDDLNSSNDYQTKGPFFRLQAKY